MKNNNQTTNKFRNKRVKIRQKCNNGFPRIQSLQVIRQRYGDRFTHRLNVETTQGYFRPESGQGTAEY